MERSLDEALDALGESDHDPDAIDALERFFRKVDALSPHLVSDAARASLVEFAQDILALLTEAPVHRGIPRADEICRIPDR